MNLIFDTLSKVTPLSEGLKSFVTKNTEPFEYKKNQTIEEYGSSCDKLYYIEKGKILCQWSPDNTPRLQNRWILIPGMIATCYESFFKGEKSIDSLKAAEKTYGRYITKEAVEEARKQFPEWGIIVDQLNLQYREMGETFGRYRSTKDAYICYKFLYQNNYEMVKASTLVELAAFVNINRDTFRKGRDRFLKGK